MEAQALQFASRPAARDALAVARDMFVHSERLDMGPLAARLGIGRSTLYRWVGDRESLLGEVIGDLADDTFELVRAQGEGRGPRWAADVVASFMEITAGFPPLRSFAERESTLAMRVLLRSGGAVQRHLHAGIRGVLTDPRAELRLDGTELDEVVDMIVLVGTTLEWAPITIGQEPELERAHRLMLSILEAHV